MYTHKYRVYGFFFFLYSRPGYQRNRVHTLRIPRGLLLKFVTQLWWISATAVETVVRSFRPRFKVCGNAMCVIATCMHTRVVSKTNGSPWITRDVGQRPYIVRQTHTRFRREVRRKKVSSSGAIVALRVTIQHETHHTYVLYAAAFPVISNVT